MPYVLYATGAALILSIIANMVLAAKLATARQDKEDADDALAERDFELAMSREASGTLLSENFELRAEKARRMAPLIAANAERKAKAASKTA
jgi:hypothetical protein